MSSREESESEVEHGHLDEAENDADLDVNDQNKYAYNEPEFRKKFPFKQTYD